MTKNLFLLLSGLFIASLAQSQQLSPSVLASDGGISKAAGISLEWTLGETFVESRSTTDRLYTQGFHQPVLLVKNVITPFEQLITGFQVTVAPNPVESVLTATIVSPGNENIYLTLIDFTGRRLPVQTTNGKFSSVHVDMSGMISGIYLLEIRNESGQLIKTFKIIKGR
jgi:hypothetical protein